MRADDRVTNAQSHPSDEELRCTFEERTADGGSLDQGLETIRRHAETCEICLLRRNVLQRGGWSSGGPAPGDCPQEPVWYAIAGGTAPSGTSATLVGACCGVSCMRTRAAAGSSGLACRFGPRGGGCDRSTGDLAAGMAPRVRATTRPRTIRPAPYRQRPLVRLEGGNRLDRHCQ